MALPFVGPSYQLATRKASIDRSVNLYLKSMETPSKAPFFLESVPGLVLFASLGAPVRGMWQSESRAFVVAGSALYEMASDGTPTNRGSLATSTGNVSMAVGNTQLVMVDGPNGYVLTLATNAFTQITDTDFPGSATVEFSDNYFLFIHPGTGQGYISAIDDATSFDALDFATAESKPDTLVSQIVMGNEWLQLGTETTESVSNYGAADYPFQRNRSISIQVGCLAAHSVGLIDNGAIWIGQDRNGAGNVYLYRGGAPTIVSTEAVTNALKQSTDLTQAVAYTYHDNKRLFYCINAPGLTSTWCYEVSVNAWHERCDIDTSGYFTASRVTHHAYAFSKHLVGASDGNVYRLDDTVYLNGSSPLVRERTSPHSGTPGRGWTFFDKGFWLDCTTGEAGQGIDPHVELSVTNDSGATWSDPALRSVGKVGERFARCFWNRMGRSRDRVTRVRFSDNAPFSIIDGGYVAPVQGLS